ncbi:MAG: DUF4340 domain-containing protein [Phycisphaerae bacterium]|nr:DUF4340 domain-containing protein [Saprospiraceae bacterium]
MKNKHLVLLFLLTLLIGLAVRRAPWQNATFFQTNLLRVDTAEVERIEIALPGQHGLVLMRNDAGWIAEQQDRSAKVPPDVVQRMLETLANLRSIRIVKTDQPDTLGFARANAIDIGVFYAHSPSERLSIGWESIENSQPATFVRLPRHGGIYLVQNQLRAVFSKTLIDFRNAAVIQLNTADVREFSIFGQNLDSLAFQKNDSTGNWESTMLTRMVTNDSIQQWLAKIARLKKLPFADLFDESHTNKTFFAQIDLGFSKQAEPLTLKIYRLEATNLPEEMPDTPLDGSQFAPFVLYFSQYPTNYFALSDTALLRQICDPF